MGIVIATVASLAEKVAFSLAAKSIVVGTSKLTKKSPEEKVAKALEKALNQVAVDNEFWKNDVKRRVDDVIRILIHTLDNPQYFNNNPLPHYLDEKTIVRFKDCLKKDPEAWDYIQKVHYEEILQDIRADVREIKNDVKESKAIEQDTNIVSHDTNERLRRIEEKLKTGNAYAHFLTDIPGKADPSNVIGREEDLDKLWKTLSEKHHVLLTGFGGIGKTKLAQMLFHAYENEFDVVAWIEYQGDLKKSFFGSITAPELQCEGNEDDKWKAMKNALTNEGKKKLFIIDNVDHIEGQNPAHDTELHHLTGWSNTSVLLTSRLSRLENYSSFSLDFLDKEDCIKVFNHYYPGNKTLDQTIVSDLVELANRHTLTVELLAKGAWQYNIKEYYKIVKQGFNQVDETIQTTYHEREEDTIEGHLRFLFSIKSRTELEKQILNSFAILPNKCRCTKEDLGNWFGFKKKDWNSALKDGWLNYDEESETYFMHPLVRTIVRFDFAEDAMQKKNIAPEGTADKILMYLIDNEKLFQINQDHHSLQRMIGIAKSVISSIVIEKSERLATLYNNIGFGYDKLGDYNNAMNYYQLSLEIKENILGTEHLSTATTYNNIGILYCELGDYEKALGQLQKVLTMREKNPNTERYDIAISYNSIGTVYFNLGDYDNALKYFQMALTERENVLGPNHPSTAISYNNLGTLFREQGNFDKAMEHYQKALKIKEDNSEKDLPSIATTYNNIGKTYFDQNDYNNAFAFFQKAYNIFEKVLGSENPNTQKVFDNLNLAKQFLQQPPSTPTAAP